MTDHPITPPLELVHQWADMLSSRSDHAVFSFAAQWGADQQLKLDAEQIAHAYQKGADQELEACCGFIGCEHSVAWSSKLRAARRPKPPSLKEQALDALELFIPFIESENKRAEAETIRKALEALPND